MAWWWLEEPSDGESERRDSSPFSDSSSGPSIYGHGSTLSSDSPSSVLFDSSSDHFLHQDRVPPTRHYGSGAEASAQACHPPQADAQFATCNFAGELSPGRRRMAPMQCESSRADYIKRLVVISTPDGQQFQIAVPEGSLGCSSPSIPGERDTAGRREEVRDSRSDPETPRSGFKGQRGSFSGLAAAESRSPTPTPSPFHSARRRAWQKSKLRLGQAGR
jgi:hypothetical protein